MADSEVQYGVRYPNGVYDWTVQSWFGDTNTKAAQDEFRSQYVTKIQSLGAEPGELSFEQRLKTVSYSKSEPTKLLEDEQDVVL